MFLHMTGPAVTAGPSQQQPAFNNTLLLSSSALIDPPAQHGVDAGDGSSSLSVMVTGGMNINDAAAPELVAPPTPVHKTWTTASSSSFFFFFS